MLNLTNQQSHTSGQWYNSASAAQQQHMLGVGQSQVTLGTGSTLYPQSALIMNTRGTKSSGRRRPGTAGRKAKLAFAQKMAGNQMQH